MSGSTNSRVIDQLHSSNIMAYRINRDILREMVMDSLRAYLGEGKSILNERVSPVIFHFCELGSLWRICEENQFVLSSGYRGYADANINQGKPFYLSCTRQMDGRQGYSSNQDVRIELDGDLLNQRYKGGPVDYWGTILGKQQYYQQRRIPSTQSRTENEDRIFSSEPIIKDAIKYIKRIDILIKENRENYDRQKQMVYAICLTPFKSLIHLYDNEKDFQTRKTDGNPELLKAISDNYDLGNIAQNVPRKMMDEHRVNDAIIDLLEMIYYGEYESDKIAKEAAYKSLRSHNMEEYLPLVKRMNLHGFFDDYFANRQTIFDTLRTDHIAYPKFMKLFSEYLRSINAKSLDDVIRHKKKIMSGGKRWDINDYNTSIKANFLCSIWRKLIIPRPDKTSIWKVFPDMRERFVSVVTNYGWEMPQHKSASDEKFVKYLEHLTKIELSVSQYMDIVNRLNVSDAIKEDLIGNLQTQEFDFWDIWYGDFLTPDDKDAALNYFKKDGRV